MLEKSQMVLLIGMGHPSPGPEVCDSIIEKKPIGSAMLSLIWEAGYSQPLINCHPTLSQDYKEGNGLMDSVWPDYIHWPDSLYSRQSNLIKMVLNSDFIQMKPLIPVTYKICVKPKQFHLGQY